jgi:hypothetical protein
MRLTRVRLSLEWVDVPLRLSIRHMMIAVAIAALALGFAVIGRRRNQYLRLARYQAQSACGAVSLRNHLIAVADRAEEEARTNPGRRLDGFEREAAFSLSLAEHAVHLRARASHWSRMATYHDELRRKYAEASSRPWQLVPSDPPPPSDQLQPYRVLHRRRDQSGEG